MSKLRTALLATAAIGMLGGAAFAQNAANTAPVTSATAQAAPTYDPAQLPTIKGTVAQYDVTPRGDVDGLILNDGTEVHMPPHLSAALAGAVKPGDAVTIHGLHARALPLVQAMSVTNDASGQTVVDTGPHGPGRGPRGHRPPPPPAAAGAGQQLEAQGVVKMDLHGPRGELNGALLDDGTMIHLPPPEAQRLSADLAPGTTLYAMGNGVKGDFGTSIAAQQIGPSKSQLTTVAVPPHGPRGRPPSPRGQRSRPVP